MKKPKEVTTPVAGRITPGLKQKFKIAADGLGISLGQYVSMMLYLAEYGETSLVEIKAQLLETINEGTPQNNVPKQQSDEVWNKEPFATMLAAVLKNEEILASVYTAKGTGPVESDELVKKGFKYNVLIQSEPQDSVYYYFTGIHGWAFTDSSRKYVKLIKKV